mgnify:CR=1 FL=1
MGSAMARKTSACARARCIGTRMVARIGEAVSSETADSEQRATDLRVPVRRRPLAQPLDRPDPLTHRGDGAVDRHACALSHGGIDVLANLTTPSGATILSEIPDGALRPGRYALPPVGPLDEPFAVVTPAGVSRLSRR